MTNIAQVAVGVINLIEDGRFIYSIFRGRNVE